MKRKLAFILAGCLAISPLSANVLSIQAYAAEQTESSEDTEASLFSVYVCDENGFELDEGAIYPLTAGESRNLEVTIGGNGESSSHFVIWSSEDPEIVSVNDDGALTALSSGTCGIGLKISNGSAQYSYRYMVRVSEPEKTEDEDVREEYADESFDEVEETAAEEISEGVPEESSEEKTDSGTDAGPAVEGDTAAEAEIAAEIEPVTEAGPDADAGTAGDAGPFIEDSAAAAEDGSAAEEVPEADASMSISKEAAAATVNKGWIKTDSGYSYADKNGRLLTGWQTIDGSIYYLDPKTYARRTGISKVDNKLYAFASDGKRQTGPRWYNAPGGKCYVNGNGTLHTGWLLRGGKWYYMASNGIMKTGCKLVLGGKVYFLDKTGAMRTGFYGFGPYLYYLSADGSAVKGWQTIGGYKYFFDGNCLARTGWYKPGNRVYYFGKHGKLQTGITKVDDYVYYLRPDGIVTTGWKKVDGKWYYLNARSRALTGWLTLDGKRYHLARNGVMDTGYKTIGGVRYHFGSDGALIPSGNNYTNTEEFIQCIAPLIIKYAPKWNVKVYSPIIAQAILESASGQSSLGKKYNNFFGLKCGTLWTGKSVNLATGEEYTPGTYTTIYANFRVYDNMEEGVKGYFEFLFKNRTRYNNLIGETDPYRYLEKIKDDGYATSSRYVQNTYNVIKSYNLTRFDP